MRRRRPGRGADRRARLGGPRRPGRPGRHARTSRSRSPPARAGRPAQVDDVREAVPRAPRLLSASSHDAADGRVRRRGHGRGMEEAGRRLGRGRRGDLRHLHRQDRHRRRGARRGAAATSPRRRARRSTSGRCSPDRARDAKPGEAHVASPCPDRGHERGRRRGAAPGDAGELQGDTAERPRRDQPRRAPRARAGRARRYSPVVQRMAAEHEIDLERSRAPGRDGRVRKQDVLALPRGGAGRRGAADAHRVALQARRAGAAPKKRAPRLRAAAGAAAAAGRAGEPLSRMRQSIGRAMVESLQTAATCTTIVEADMTRVEAARRQAGRDLPADRRPRDGRDAARVPALNATLEGERSRATRTRAPRHRRLARRGRADRAGDPRRPGALASRAWRARIKDARAPGARQAS